MPSPNQNSADMKAWLAKVNANEFGPSRSFGEPDAGTNQANPSSTPLPNSSSSDGSLNNDQD